MSHLQVDFVPRFQVIIGTVMQIGPAMGTYGAIMFVSLRQYFLVVETFDKYFTSELMLANKFRNARFCLN